MLGDIVNAAVDAVHGVVHFFQTLAPGGLDSSWCPSSSLA